MQKCTEGRPCEDTDKMAIQKPRESPQKNTKPADTLILDFEFQRLWKK